MAAWAERFERFRERYRRDDGSKWSGAALERATRKRISANYVSKLKNGHVEDPSYEKIYWISQAMGIPMEAWMEETDS